MVYVNLSAQEGFPGHAIAELGFKIGAKFGYRAADKGLGFCSLLAFAGGDGVP